MASIALTVRVHVVAGRLLAAVSNTGRLSGDRLDRLGVHASPRGVLRVAGWRDRAGLGGGGHEDRRGMGARGWWRMVLMGGAIERDGAKHCGDRSLNYEEGALRKLSGPSALSEQTDECGELPRVMHRRMVSLCKERGTTVV